MEVINDYISPLLKDALAKESKADKQKPSGIDVVDGESLLDHLVKLSDGEPMEALDIFRLKVTSLLL